MSSKESRSRVLGDQNLMKNALQRAADLRGQALSDFVLAAAYERAVATISAEQVLSLSAADSTRFAEAIIQPVVVDTALRDRFILAYPVTQGQLMRALERLGMDVNVVTRRSTAAIASSHA